MNLADAINLGCACQTLQPNRLREQLETSPALGGLTARLAESHPHLFSASAVFLDPGVQQQIVMAVQTLERVIALPAWHAQALARANPIAALDWGPAGVFMGYDFHLAADGPKLIEINSNAGGALLNASMFDANLVDEINLTISPMVTGDDSPRLSNGAPALHSDYQVAHILEHEGFLFIRYLRNR